MRFKVDLSLPKLVRLRFCVQLGADVGAKVDVRLRLRGRDPLRWRAALAPGRHKARLISDGVADQDEETRAPAVNGNGRRSENVG